MTLGWSGWRSAGPRQNIFVIWLTIVEADGSTMAPNYYETSDGKYVWERKPSESAKDFKRRVSDEVDRINNHGTVVLLPFKGRGL